MPDNIPLEDWSGARTTDELHRTIREFVAASNRSARRMLQLTWAITALTAVMLIAVGMQVWFALR